MLINGNWQSKWDPYQKSNEQGEFIRQTSSFRHWVTPDGSAGPSGDAGFKAEPGRYHLYVALICPWASRTLMVRKLKGLEKVISISVVDPRLTEQGWRFAQKEHGIAGSDQDLLNGTAYVHQLYTKANKDFTGKATVPILWDKLTNTIVNNESADIIQMLNSAFDEWGNKELNLRPSALLPEIEKYNNWLYEDFNNGVYQAGFAKSQSAYKIANEKVFNSLNKLENILQDGRQFIFKEQLTETDIRAFVTLIRFDAAYHGLFKCNLKSIYDFPNLQSYMERIYALPGVNETVNIEHIKQGYYSIEALNPMGIVPTGPNLNFITEG